MFDCTTNRYAELYARWLENPGTLLDLAGWEPGMSLLDLCGGTGAVSCEAFRRGAGVGHVKLLDLNPRCDDPRIDPIRGSAESILPRWPVESFDVVVCRQALAYLELSPYLFKGIARVLKPGGKLVFNTFPWPRIGSRWVWKRYDYGGRHYYEAALCLSKHVWHIQASPGLGFDVTRFRGYTEAEIRQSLEFHFSGEVHHAERSVRWICTPRRK